MTSTTPVDTRDMLVVHDSIRRQFGQVPALVRDVAPGDGVRAAVVADHVDLLGALLHHHHAGEDRLLWPVLQPRVRADVVSTVERMERQHEGIADAQESVTTAMVAWRAAAGEDEREALATALEGLVERITEHLAAEEEHILPLAAEHMTPAQCSGSARRAWPACPGSNYPWSSGWSCTRRTRRSSGGCWRTPRWRPRLLMPRLAPRAYARYARRLHGTTTP